MEAALPEAGARVSRWRKGTFLLPENAPESRAFACLIDGLVVHIHAGFFQQSCTKRRLRPNARWNSTPWHSVLGETPLRYGIREYGLL